MLLKFNCMAIDSSIVASTANTSRILFDIRDPNVYGKSHIKNAVNLFTSNLLLRRVQRGSLTIASLLPFSVVQQLKSDNGYDSIVLYDENSSNENEARAITVIASALRKEFPKKNTVYLNGGYSEFCDRYPSQCEFDYPVENPTPFQISINDLCDIANDPTDKNIFSPATDTTPVPILPNLYLGSALHSSKKELMDKLGITAILNVSKTCPVLFRNSYEYKTIPVDDTNSENISLYFDEAVKFIDDIIDKNGIVLVHCRAGISRSATICIAYLMRKYNYTLDQAYEYTKKKRSAISPNFNFLGQLLKLEDEISSTKFSDENRCPLTVTLPTMDRRCPLTVTLPTMDRDINSSCSKGPLTLAPLNSKKQQFFTYSPKSCVNFFSISSSSGNMSPLCPILLTPS